MPIRTADQVVGTVTTLRDRTELATLQHELGATRGLTDTLRAQTHEFDNRLHTISGLIQIGEYDEVVAYVGRVNAARDQLDEDVAARLEDPALAALLVAKASLAAERGITLVVTRESQLPLVERDLSDDLVTVVGNLVDNALDAVPPGSGGRVEVSVFDDGADVVVEVRDSGAGVPEGLVGDVFERGFSTKPSRDGGRGLGLALVRLACTRRGGKVSVRNDNGAVFRATLPRATARSAMMT